jgi:hypothetical protein
MGIMRIERAVLLAGSMACLLATDAARADPLPERADGVVDYRISVTLDAGKKQLQGRARVTWRNPSTDAVPDLWFHLYLNAFQNSQSTFMRESGGSLRSDEMPTDGWGWINVDTLKLADGTDLKPAFHFQSPDDGNADDRTVARVRLPAAVPPGASIAFDVTFTAQLPKVFARTGYAGDYFLVGQWFPKLAVYEPAGMRGRAAGGWNCHQFHANSEFYADFGHYRVDLTVPARFIVGATGERAERRENQNGTITYVYDQANVHDFAWTASPYFVEVKRRFESAREVSNDDYARAARRLNRPLDELRLRDVDVTFLMQPGHMAQLDRHVRAAMLSIKSFGLSYGYYPHRTLTVVDPPFGAGGSGGMEYPTFITAGTSAVLNYPPFTHILGPEEVTVHEFGHQYFQGMLASNEFEEAWLDEGINSYATGRVLDEGYGNGREATMIELLGWRFTGRDYRRVTYTPDAIFDAIRQPSWTYLPGSNAYAFNSYYRAELMLRTLELHLGEDLMARVMRTYAERWRFKHPSTDDFLTVANEVAGRDVRALLTPALDRGEVIDYEIGEVTSEPARTPAGYFDSPKGRTLTTQKEADDKTATDAASSHLFDTSVIVRRRGDAIWPVDIAFKFEGKAVEHVAWDGRTRWKRFEFHRPEKLEWVDIDPERRLELDVDWLKNATRTTADRRTAVRLTSRWILVLQQMITWFGL